MEALLRTEISDYEEVLRQAASELGPTGKPLKNRFVAKEIQRRVTDGKPIAETVPKTIRDIISQIQGLTFHGSILEKNPATK